MKPWMAPTFLVILALNTSWFVIYSGLMGARGFLWEDPAEASRVFADNASWANAAIAVHMLTGGFLTVLAPLQALPVWRRRWPRLHRRFGKGIVGLAALTGIGGLIYIASEGTVGGPWMSLWFGIYGGAMLWAAASTYQFARARDFERHFEWATRLIVLAVGSWIYRMHYVIWYAATDGLASTRQFTGLFDHIQVFAFFVPYLILAEIGLRIRRARVAAS